MDTQLLDFAGARIEDVHRIYLVVLPFSVPVVIVTAKHCAAIGYSRLSQRYQRGLTIDTSPTLS